MMKQLGTYQTKNGEMYDCIFYPKEEFAKAIGPLSDGTCARSPIVNVPATSEEEAKKKLSEKLGPGRFI